MFDAANHPPAGARPGPSLIALVLLSLCCAQVAAGCRVSRYAGDADASPADGGAPQAPDGGVLQPPPPPPAGVDKVMTYNVKEGGIRPGWKDVVRAENADIIVFVETQDWDDEKLNELLQEFNGYFSSGSFAPPDDEAPYVAHAEPDPPPYGGTAILTRYPIVQVTRVDSLELDDGAQWRPIRDFMVWQLDIDGIPVFVTGVHPKCCGGANNALSRERDIEGLVNWFDQHIPDGHIIIAGDFNAFSYGDEAAGNNQGDLGYGPLEILLDENPGDRYDSFAATRHRYVDGYRHLVPNISPADHTYRLSPYSSRIDFIVVSDSLRPILTAPATIGSGTESDPGSDHYTVDVHLDFSALAGAGRAPPRAPGTAAPAARAR